MSRSDPSPLGHGRGLSWLGALVVAAALVWHALMVLRPADPAKVDDLFATQFYAARVAWEGGDPYDAGAVESVAAVDGVTRGLVPLAGPPIVLVLTAPLLPLGLPGATVAWGVLGELALLGALAILWRQWAALDDAGAMLPIFAALGAITYAVGLSAMQGAAHPLILLLLVAAAHRVERDPLGAGALLAVTIGMSPAPVLIAAVWLAHGRWGAVGAALVGWVALSVVALPVVAGLHQMEFYTTSLADLASAAERARASFGDVSLLHLWRRIFPGPDAQLTPAARALAAASVFAVLSATFVAFRTRPVDEVQRAGQVAALLALAPILGVRSDEATLVLALPAMALAAMAVYRGWLGVRWLVPLALAIAVLAYEQPALESLALRLLRSSVLKFGVEELKFVALAVLVLAAARLGAGAADPSRPPPPSAAL